MDAAEQIVRRLLEAPENLDDPSAIGPIPAYIAPGAFQGNVKDILDHAMFLKEQAEQAGALGVIEKRSGPLFKDSPKDIDRAFLLIAVRQILEEEELKPRKIAQVLEREMHSIWS